MGVCARSNRRRHDADNERAAHQCGAEEKNEPASFRGSRRQRHHGRVLFTQSRCAPFTPEKTILKHHAHYECSSCF